MTGPGTTDGGRGPQAPLHVTDVPAARLPAVSEGGDPACWLDRVCPECGRIADAPAPTCPACGSAYPD